MVYIADGLTDGADFRRFAAALGDAGPVTEICCDAAPARLLLPPDSEADRLVARLAQAPQPIATQAVVLAQTGDGRTLARTTIALPAGASPARPASCCRRSSATGWRAWCWKGRPPPALPCCWMSAGAAGRSVWSPATLPPPNAVLRPGVLSAPRALSLHRIARGEHRDAAAARPVGAGAGGPAAARRAGARCGGAMGGKRRVADPLRRPAHRRATDRRDRSAVAGETAGWRPSVGRRAVLERAGRTGAVPLRLAVRRACA